jgi:hypothetical protein
MRDHDEGAVAWAAILRVWHRLFPSIEILVQQALGLGAFDPTGVRHLHSV